MHPACIDVVTRILGKAPTPGMTKDIDDRMSRQMRILASDDPEAWRQMSQADRMNAAAEAAGNEMIHEAQKKQQRIALQIAAHDRVESFLNDKRYENVELYANPGDRLRAVSRLLDFDTKTNGKGFTSAASWSKAVERESFANVRDALTASNPKFFQLFENSQGVSDLIHEMWGEDTGNAAAKDGAKAWASQMEELRQRYNAAGGDVGKLDDWHYPQSHSRERIAAAGFDRWADDTLAQLDRSKFLNGDGTRMSDADVRDFLGHAFDSIVTDGANKRESTRSAGYGLQAKRGSEHRQLFFKDADAWLQYQASYGEKSLYSSMTSHVRGISRDIAMAETLGPNPDALFGQMNQQALLAELRADPTAEPRIRKDAAFNERLFDYVSGRQQVVDTKLAERFQAFRNFTTGAKLGKVVITALGDEAGLASTAWANKIPYTDVFMRELSTLDPTDSTARRIMERTGVGLDSMLGGLNRWAQDDYGSGWTGKLANTVMHMSGAERMWDARRQGLSSVLMSYLADTVQKVEHFSDIDKADHGVLADKGITENDWQVWRRAEPEMWADGKTPMLTPNAIHAIPDSALADLGNPVDLKRHAATNLLAHVLEEAGMGAMDTGPRQRTALAMGTTKGTWGGELLRTSMLFKGYAASMMMKHWQRAASMPGAGSQWGYMAPIFVYGTLIAAAGNQLRNVLAGRDPENQADPRFWASAILRGGGLGFFGDFFYDQMTEQGTSLTAALAGPLGTTAEDVLSMTHGAIAKAARGQLTDEGGNLIRFTKQNVPLLNMWYTQSAMDHILWNQMQEAASPGYLDRMQARAATTKGTSWFWPPDAPMPERAPDASLNHLFDLQKGGEEIDKWKDTAGRMAQSVGID